jgi:hypothetical protein
MYILPPIEKIFVFKSDIVVKRMPDEAREFTPGLRSEVAEFSFSSRRKLAFVAANTDVVFRTMITLTYPREFETDGSVVKRHLRAFLQYMRRVDVDADYLWFLEFQRRGAPHIHLLSSVMSRSVKKTDVSRRWYKIVSSGDRRHLRAGTRVEAIRKPGGGARYAVKYALKMYQKVVPVGYRDVGRFWGHSRGVRPSVRAIYRVRNDEQLRLYLLRWLEVAGKGLDYSVLFGAAPYLERARGGVGIVSD